jgi:ligand-binding SRPBCC domain-containing protein
LLHWEWPAFRMIAHDGNLQPGSRTWFEVNFARILPVALGFEQKVYQPPQCYSEELTHGPFCKFTHRHEFEAVEDGTRVRDILEISLPWYYGGEWAMRFLVAPTIEQAFSLRGEALQKLTQNDALFT